MNTNTRQSKQPRKGAQNATRRPTARSSGARSSLTFSPTSSSPRPTNTGPNPSSLSNLANGSRSEIPHDRVLMALTGLTGTTVTVSTKTSQRFEGVVSSTRAKGDTTGVTLIDVKEISNPGAPHKHQLFIASTNIDSWSSGPADAILAYGDTFHTDTEISQRKMGGHQERELQAWQAPSDAPALASSFAHGDEATFGPSSGNISWDRFAVNEKLFGVKATFDEDAYTTKLDRNGVDFKERERKAQKLANEILESATNNPHLAEERNQQVDDSWINEEDKYGAVVRGANVYIPPGARKTTGASNAAAKTEVPKVAVNGPDGTSVSSQTQSPASTSKAASPAPAANSSKTPAVPAFRDFVTIEKQRLNQRRQALAKNEMDKRIAELVKFSQSFKLPFQMKMGGQERELQAWQAPSDALASSSFAHGDEATFGPSSSWDQFAVNEKPFGVKTTFDEDAYTTKLDRNGVDFKERERKAQKFANEILVQVDSPGPSKIDAVLKQLEWILGDKSRYQILSSQRGELAQSLLDHLQTLSDYPQLNARLRTKIFAALLRLSRKSELYPSCLALNNIRMIGDYPVAGGGFGDIWKGLIGDQVACLKVVKVYGDSDVHLLLKGFLKEAILWRQLEHPNVLPFLGLYFLDESKQRVCLVSPWMENGNARQYLSKDSEQNVDRIVLVYDVANGLSYLHARKIVHGDLKAVNILITTAGRALVADFGLSRLVDSGVLEWSSLSTKDRAGGTTRWLAPECLLRGLPLTYKSDIYAFGCVCYEILTGLLPFHESAQDPQVVFQLIGGKRPVRPLLTLPYLTDVMWAMMEECWTEEPSDRPEAYALPDRISRFANQSMTMACTEQWDHPIRSQLWSNLQHPELCPSASIVENFLFGSLLQMTLGVTSRNPEEVADKHPGG